MNLKSASLSALFFLFFSPVFCQNEAISNTLVINADLGKDTISRHIYGQFSEHLGRGIYEGIWVGEDSDIPNTRGIRNDVVAALKQLNVPNLRWPGGCFADEYHWVDGIGDPESRPTMVNTHWGGVTEDNSFGTHEFLDLCEQLDTEPYITANVGSGTVEEMADWVEYLTFDGVSPMAKLRAENGHPEAWDVKYWGVGNESWGCGGNMRPEYYADLYNRFATYSRNYGDNQLYRIAGGSSDDDYNWTEVIMKNVKHSLMDGVSMHFYTINRDWDDKVSATDFDEASYFEVVEKSLLLDKYISGHANIMDKYDPEKKIGLIVDEWGTWHREEPGTKSGFLYQQNTLRDAFVAALSLNIFHKHADRVHMANIAQTINVLQAMILTQEEKMLLTPTYHVFDMYKVHQDATLLPHDLKTKKYTHEGKTMDALYASSSRAEDGTVNLSLVNIHPTQQMDISCEIRGFEGKSVSGRILTADALNTYNTFDEPEKVTTTTFEGARIRNGKLQVNMPAKSIIVLNIKP
ncbi:alpha-N-arabinofuranosidase [Catalinimonas niigatensis]|uniref:alpha-N-arabinofuranosidase n=1 Tax=Catalinimonas niigatensis TaxID=1397264 RepID=UPI00266637F2|nr:alpha-N-arabinofuranosidase [Catalinimonas niigatensis]WPP51457.1 alpha-N-arabinofuranosidase [Catalinimonas niigatensis]